MTQQSWATGGESSLVPVQQLSQQLRQLREGTVGGGHQFRPGIERQLLQFPISFLHESQDRDVFGGILRLDAANGLEQAGPLGRDIHDHHHRLGLDGRSHQVIDSRRFHAVPQVFEPEREAIARNPLRAK